MTKTRKQNLIKILLRSQNNHSRHHPLQHYLLKQVFLLMKRNFSKLTGKGEMLVKPIQLFQMQPIKRNYLLLNLNLNPQMNNNKSLMQLIRSLCLRIKQMQSLPKRKKQSLLLKTSQLFKKRYYLRPNLKQSQLLPLRKNLSQILSRNKFCLKRQLPKKRHCLIQSQNQIQ